MFLGNKNRRTSIHAKNRNFKSFLTTILQKEPEIERFPAVFSRVQ